MDEDKIDMRKEKLGAVLSNWQMLAMVLMILDEIDEGEYYRDENPYEPLDEAYKLIEEVKHKVYETLDKEIDEILRKTPKEAEE